MKRKFEYLDNFSNILDSKNIDSLLELLSEDCLFQAGNNPIIKGKKEIKKTFETFYPLVKSVKHDIKDIFESDDNLVQRGTVTYTRIDNTNLTVSVCDIFKIKDSKIVEYYIYIDWSELFK
ncbi:nuclear transport factor 2 family protein [Cetobacterium sp. 8H]|uniref:nuclear transport factor 2 family protein n=1 Tax=Cetobacterium sp. 8H TaxID=2759681 RepID=UPI00163BD149|nr:nuclear transport factor 2 family protein [Cetobacterium sp. 8H]MBC2852165.1 nuclear transport factor 2 family protein [Cetobacterium sp. 8H]